MAENIRLVNIIPSQPVPNVQAPQLPQGGSSQAVAINLPAGTVLSGFIVNRDASGNPILRTPTGDVTFSSNFFLKIGSEVSLRVETSGGNTLAHILSVDGQPPEVAAAQSAFANEPDVIISQQFTNAGSGNANTPANNATVAQSGSVPSPATQLSTSLGSTVSGTLISQPPEVVATAQMPVGTQITLKIVSLVAAPNALPPEVVAAASEPSSIAAQASQPAAYEPPQANAAFYATYARAASPATPLAAAPSAPVTTQPVQSTPAVANVIASSPQQPSAPAVQVPVTTTIAVNEPTPTQPASPVISTTIATQSPEPAIVTAATNTAVPQANTPQPAIPLSANAVPNATPTIIATAVTPPVATRTTPAINTQVVTQESLAPQPVVTGPIQPGQVITAKVIGNETTGEALLQTPAGVVRLQPGTVVPSGSTITFEITETTAPPTANTGNSGIITLPTDPTPLTQLAQQWTALQQIFDLLAGRPTNTGLDTPSSISPGTPNIATSAALPNILPNITPQSISAGLLVFISALRSGDFTNWIGKNNVKWLEDQGQGDIVKKAEGEFQVLARQFTEPVAQQWQPLFFPVAVDGQLQQVRMYVKRDGKQGKDNKKTKDSGDTRFVIEVDLSKLGELQMDGFVRRNEKDMQFDMMIRSLLPLSTEIQQDILNIYSQTGAITGYKGSLIFQAVKAFPINPMNEIVASQNTVMA